MYGKYRMEHPVLWTMNAKSLKRDIVLVTDYVLGSVPLLLDRYEEVRSVLQCAWSDNMP